VRRNDMIRHLSAAPESLEASKAFIMASSGHNAIVFLALMHVICRDGTELNRSDKWPSLLELAMVFGCTFVMIHIALPLHTSSSFSSRQSEFRSLRGLFTVV